MTKEELEKAVQLRQEIQVWETFIERFITDKLKTGKATYTIYITIKDERNGKWVELPKPLFEEMMKLREVVGRRLIGFIRSKLDKLYDDFKKL